MSVRLMASYDFSLVLEPEGSAEGSDGAPSQQPLMLHSSLRKKLRSLLSSKTVVDFSHTPASGGGGETLQVCQWVCPCAPVLLLAESSPFTPLLPPTPSPSGQCHYSGSNHFRGVDEEDPIIKVSMQQTQDLCNYKCIKVKGGGACSQKDWIWQF